MVDIKGLGGIKPADKSKAKARADAASGPSFASLLEDAQAPTEPVAAPPPATLGLPAGYVPLDDDLPQNPRQQARQLLHTLQTLAEDAFSGSPTAAVARLESLTAQLDEASLTSAQKDALNEARTRAAVEVAKLKG